MSFTVQPSEDRTAERNALIERLVGETAEPQKVIAAARALGERALPPIARNMLELVNGPIQLDFQDVQLGRISEVFAQGGDSEPLTVAASANSPDALMIAMDANAMSLVTALLFGASAEAPVAAIDRPLSSTERQICAKVFQAIAEALNGSGQRAMNVRFPLPAPIFGDDRRKQVHRDGPSARLVFRIATAGGSGEISVTMPQRVVLAPRGEDAKAGSDWKSRFSGEIMRSMVKLDATIPGGRLTLSDISGLRVGQVLELPKDAAGETKLAAKGKTLFVCEFGKLGQNYTVRVKEPFDPDADLMDGLLAR
ncbi:MAG: FliM/FliN family flagellar motor switch protein [Mesorhizobium sp.]